MCTSMNKDSHMFSFLMFMVFVFLTVLAKISNIIVGRSNGNDILVSFLLLGGRISISMIKYNVNFLIFFFLFFFLVFLRQGFSYSIAFGACPGTLSL